MDEATDVIELSLFPLNTVLFPGQVLPLHVFEDRYRLMVRRCLAEETPFGVVLIKRGREVGDTAEPHTVGTLARILESTHLNNGTMNIVTVGMERFRIRRLIHDQPYLRGEAELFPMDESIDAEEAKDIANRVRAGTVRYIELIAKAAGLRIEIQEVPDTPQKVGYLAAVAMQIDNDEKQSLLGSDTLESILRAELALLGRENALLRWMDGSKEWPETVQLGPSGSILPN